MKFIQSLKNSFEIIKIQFKAEKIMKELKNVF